MRAGRRANRRSNGQDGSLSVFTVQIERRRPGDGSPRIETFCYEMQNSGDTVATVLLSLNDRQPLCDAAGRATGPIRWECSCLQKKCGACAMLINGRPALACDSFLRDLPKTILLAPLRKFPVVADLQIDRGIMQKNLLENRQWMEREAAFREARAEDAYAASRCLQCGLCLEVCPNYDPDGGFTGAAGAVPAARVLSAQRDPEQSSLADTYRRRVFEGCGKSLACRNICPAEIEIGEMLAQSNAIAVWKRRSKR